jgi:hypothetical protein
MAITGNVEIIASIDPQDQAEYFLFLGAKPLTSNEVIFLSNLFPCPSNIVFPQHKKIL